MVMTIIRGLAWLLKLMTAPEVFSEKIDDKR